MYGTNIWNIVTKDYGVDFICDMSVAHTINLWERMRRERSTISEDSKVPKSASMSSTCPGWTLYAEKVCDAGILPYISVVRSPQQIQGSLIKRHFAPTVKSMHGRTVFHPSIPLLGTKSLYWWHRSRIKEPVPHPTPESSATPSSSSSGSVYHVMISPCYDRKIEAVRPQYERSDIGKEVDTVLATTELLELLEESPSFSLTFAPKKKEKPIQGLIYNSWNLNPYWKELPRPREFWDITDDDKEWKEVRNGLKEMIIDEEKYVQAYGFKNVQNAIRRVKGKNNIRHIEVMACPSACLNGGGQISSNDKTDNRISRLQSLWPQGEIPDETILRQFYEKQSEDWWTTSFTSLKGNSIRW